jgi:hypothetical protein
METLKLQLPVIPTRLDSMNIDKAMAGHIRTALKMSGGNVE